MYAPSTESVRRGTESVLDSTESVLQADGDLLLAVEMADRMERGEPTNQRTSPYIRRRNTQVAALQALWRGTFQVTPPTRESVVSLLRLSGDDASLVAEMMQDVVERVASGLKVQSLYGYVRKAVENRVREDRERPARPSQTNNRVVEGDESLAPPTPEFLALMERTQKLAALWGDE